MCDVPPKRPIRQGTVDRVPWFTPNGLNPDSSPRARVFFGCLTGGGLRGSTDAIPGQTQSGEERHAPTRHTLAHAGLRK